MFCSALSIRLPGHKADHKQTITLDGFIRTMSLFW